MAKTGEEQDIALNELDKSKSSANLVRRSDDSILDESFYSSEEESGQEEENGNRVIDLESKRASQTNHECIMENKLSF